jgi:outer membrane protein assembly factor BamB
MPKILTSRLLLLGLFALSLASCNMATTSGVLPSILPSGVTPGEEQLADSGVAAPTLIPSITPTPGPQDIADAQLLWQWEETAPPSALAAVGDTLAVIVADGRFQWLDAETGQPLAGNVLWPDGIQGDSWGQVYADHEIAVVAAVETRVSEETGFPETRSQLTVFDMEGTVLWRLPALGTQHNYSAALTPDSVLVGTHHGTGTNILGAYDRLTGEAIWETGGSPTGYEVIVFDDDRIYALLNEGAEGGGVAAYDRQSGELIWTQADSSVRLSDDLLIAGDRLFVLTQPAAVALDPEEGHILWSTPVALAPEAGMDAEANLLYVVPAPTAELDYRPGVIGVSTEDGEFIWHTLIGLVADPLAASGEALWTIIKDYETSQVWLGGLDAESGLEYARIEVSDRPEQIYRLVASGRRVYVLGESLLAYGY